MSLAYGLPRRGSGSRNEMPPSSLGQWIYHWSGRDNEFTIEGELELSFHDNLNFLPLELNSIKLFSKWHLLHRLKLPHVRFLISPKSLHPPSSKKLLMRWNNILAHLLHNMMSIYPLSEDLEMKPSFNLIYRHKSLGGWSKETLI